MYKIHIIRNVDRSYLRLCYNSLDYLYFHNNEKSIIIKIKGHWVVAVIGSSVCSVGLTVTYKAYNDTCVQPALSWTLHFYVCLKI